MKLKLKSRKPTRDEDEDEDKPRKSPKMGSADWMIQDRDEIRRAQKKQEAEAKASRRPPELFLMDGEEKYVRFRSNEPIAVWRYSLKIGGKYRRVTQPSPGDKDLFAAAGMRANLGYCYEVIDIKGYISKKDGKKHKNVPKFLWVSGKVEKQLEKIRDKKGSLTKCNIEISRSGSDTSTTYTFFLDDEPTPMTSDMKNAENLMPRFGDYYAPPSLDQQRLLTAGVPTDDEEEEEQKPRKKRRSADEDED